MQKIAQRGWQRLLVLIALVAMLILPVATAAGTAVYTDREYIPPATTETEDLQVGPIYVTIPAGALPQGGLLRAKVKVDDSGAFEAVFSPDVRFATNIIIDFGPNVSVVYYWENGVPIPQELVDGKLFTDHFSRYSGW